MARKTVDLVTLISRVNGINAAPSSTEDGRREVNNLTISLLVDADMYSGFTYVDPGPFQNPVGHARVQEGDYDSNRIRIHVHPDLRE